MRQKGLKTMADDFFRGAPPDPGTLIKRLTAAETAGDFEAARRAIADGVARGGTHYTMGLQLERLADRLEELLELAGLR